MAIETVPEWMAGLEDEDVAFIKKFLLASGSLDSLPSCATLINEFIALVKETAVAGYIALGDLTRGGDQIQVGDSVIVVTLEHGLHDLRDIVEE